MSIEFIGFVAGAAVVGSGVLLLLRHEGWKAIRSAYGRDSARRGGGNALIWPSR
jgi:hypothetical protein